MGGRLPGADDETKSRGAEEMSHRAAAYDINAHQSVQDDEWKPATYLPFLVNEKSSMAIYAGALKP